MKLINHQADSPRSASNSNTTKTSIRPRSANVNLNKSNTLPNISIVQSGQRKTRNSNSISKQSIHQSDTQSKSNIISNSSQTKTKRYKKIPGRHIIDIIIIWHKKINYIS